VRGSRGERSTGPGLAMLIKLGVRTGGGAAKPLH
jgi:hypothetical protein